MQFNGCPNNSTILYKCLFDIQLNKNDENALANWVYQLGSQFMGVSKDVILQKAKEIAEATGKSFNTEDGYPSNVRNKL